MADSTVMFPFRIMNGSVAVTTEDSHALASKMLFCLGTEVNERVMRPSWGINIMQTVYMIGGDLEEAIPEAVTMAVGKWFPKIQKVDVEITPHPTDPTHMVAEVRYGRIDSEVDEIVRVDVPTTEGVA